LNCTRTGSNREARQEGLPGGRLELGLDQFQEPADNAAVVFLVPAAVEVALGVRQVVQGLLPKWVAPYREGSLGPSKCAQPVQGDPPLPTAGGPGT
jgi:hypothetical protein